MTQQLSSEWRGWISENIARGCTDSSIVASMVHAGIDPALARAAIVTLRLPGHPPLDNLSSQFHTGNSIWTQDHQVQVVMRVSKPCVAVLNNVLTPEECDELIRLSRIKLKRSTIVDPLSGEYRVIEDRSSSGTFFALNENEFISRLDRRISEVVNWPAENGEGLQILNYQIGGEYKAHFDYFPPDDPGSQPHLNNGGQRVSTLVVYLNDVNDGGETVFPRINLSVCPRKGSAVYFEYCNATGEVDPMTLHGGAPVRAGEKWIATKWMRQSRYGSN